jgi:monoamine oxidase
MFGSSDQRYHVRGGNQLIPAAIANSLNTPVRLGMKMTSIALQADGTYALTFVSNGKASVVIADLVVMTIPFAVLRNLDYAKAGFDALKKTAIQELGRGQNGKLQLQFNSRYWSASGAWPGNASSGLTYTDEGYQNTWEVTRAQPGATGILVDYTGGSGTVAKTASLPFTTIAGDPGAANDAQTFLAHLEAVLPGGTQNWNGLATSSLPALDPNLGCSYSYWKPGQYTQFAGYERVRQGNVFFAGEHCSINFQGYMEGGATEGARAALEILTQLAG